MAPTTFKHPELVQGRAQPLAREWLLGDELKREALPLRELEIGRSRRSNEGELLAHRELVSWLCAARWFSSTRQVLQFQVDGDQIVLQTGHCQPSGMTVAGGPSMNG